MKFLKQFSLVLLSLFTSFYLWFFIDNWTLKHTPKKSAIVNDSLKAVSFPKQSVKSGRRNAVCTKRLLKPRNLIGLSLLKRSGHVSVSFSYCNITAVDRQGTLIVVLVASESNTETSIK